MILYKRKTSRIIELNEPSGRFSQSVAQKCGDFRSRRARIHAAKAVGTGQRTRDDSANSFFGNELCQELNG